MREPLTHALLRERISKLFEEVIAEAGPIEEVAWERLVCDCCGRTLNLAAEMPEGWTTEGSHEQGYDDRCGPCSDGGAVQVLLRDRLVQAAREGRA